VIADEVVEDTWSDAFVRIRPAAVASGARLRAATTG
jgi:hypothetical protein